jgi:hypothetical protein
MQTCNVQSRASSRRSCIRSFSCRARRQAVHARASAQLIDGKQIAADIRQELAAEVATLKAATGKVPGLAVVLVGARKDSETYVRNKKKACAEVHARMLWATEANLVLNATRCAWHSHCVKLHVRRWLNVCHVMAWHGMSTIGIQHRRRHK